MALYYILLLWSRFLLNTFPEILLIYVIFLCIYWKNISLYSCNLQMFKEGKCTQREKGRYNVARRNNEWEKSVSIFPRECIFFFHSFRSFRRQNVSINDKKRRFKKRLRTSKSIPFFFSSHRTLEICTNTRALKKR